MFNFTPPIWGNVVKYCSLTLIAFVLLCAYMAGYQAGLTGCSSDEVQPVAVPPSVLCNRDSMLYYAEQAYLTNAPKALFFTAAGYYAKRDGLYPDTLYIPTVDQSTAEEFLYLSASQDYPPALRLIRVLSAQGDWHHSLPTLNR